MSKRLYLSSTNKKLAGVCGGIAEYFNIDPTIVRLIWLIAVFAYGDYWHTLFVGLSYPSGLCNRSILSHLSWIT